MSVDAVSGSGYFQASFNQAPASTGATKEDLSKLQTSLRSEDPAKAQDIETLISNFDKIDLNRDGTLNAAELATYKKTIVLTPQKGILGDGVTKEQLTALNGKVKSAGEDDADLKNLITSFDEADTDKDGKVNAEEIDSLIRDSAARERASGQDPSGESFISPRDLQKLLKRYQLALNPTPQPQPSLLQEVSA